ncbi:hypothetical protein ACFVX6_15980 [Streptomyces sp. NPDC058289]|uniref:hypothetical protein n=1 Tax=Streptomyces sp. NPDC058289 TaxID=3346425 RepID=UPI0036EBF2EF
MPSTSDATDRGLAGPGPPRGPGVNGSLLPAPAWCEGRGELVPWVEALRFSGGAAVHHGVHHYLDRAGPGYAATA